MQGTERVEEQPQVVREVKAFAHGLDNINIFIEDGELIGPQEKIKQHIAAPA